MPLDEFGDWYNDGLPEYLSPWEKAHGNHPYDPNSPDNKRNEWDERVEELYRKYPTGTGLNEHDADANLYDANTLPNPERAASRATNPQPGGPGDPEYDNNPRDYMIKRDKASWERELRAKWPAGLPWDQGALDGVIRQVSYAQNAGRNPADFIAEAITAARARQTNIPGGPRQPSSGGGGGGNSGGNSGGGGTSTLAAITTPTPTPPAAARPTATQTPAPPMRPYSARATTPYSTGQMSMTAPSAMTGQVPMAGMPAASTNAMGNMLGSAQPQNPYALANAWNMTNANYRQAGDAYAAQQGGNYNPAPWSGTRLGAPRNVLGTPMTVGSPNDVALATDAAERRRAYRFGMQNAQANQANAAMGQQDFNGQMDNWLRAYNEWNKKGVDPLAIPGGVV